MLKKKIGSEEGGETTKQMLLTDFTVLKSKQQQKVQDHTT